MIYEVKESSSVMDWSSDDDDDGVEETDCIRPVAADCVVWGMGQDTTSIEPYADGNNPSCHDGSVPMASSTSQ